MKMKMKKITFLLFILLLSMWTGVTHASGYEGKIIRILTGPTYGTKVFLSVNGDPGQTGCHTNGSYNYVFDGATDSGKITLSVALSAYAAQKLVRVDGTSTCTIYNGVENLQHIISK